MTARRSATIRWLLAAVAGAVLAGAWATGLSAETASTQSAPASVRAPRPGSGQAEQPEETGVSSVESRPLGQRPAGRIDGGALTEWLQPLGALAIVIALIFLLRAAVRRLGGRARLGVGGRVVEVLARSHLSPRCELCLVRWAGRLLLLGLSPNGPVTLSEIRDPQEVQTVLASLGESQKNPAGGSRAIRDVSRRIRSRLSSESGGTD